MRRLLCLLGLGFALIAPSVGLVSYFFYKGPLCVDIKNELLSRAKALISLHTLRDPPAIELVQSCGLSPLPDALWFDAHKLLTRLGMNTIAAPLSWQELKLRSTPELLDHPLLGSSRWVLGFDGASDKAGRSRVLGLLQTYLEGSSRPTLIEVRRARGVARPDTFPVRPFTELEAEPSRPSLSASWKDGVRERFTSLWESLDFEGIRTYGLYLSMFLTAGIVLRRQRQGLLAFLRKKPLEALMPGGEAAEQEQRQKALRLFAPYFIDRWRERAADLMWTLLEKDPEGMKKRVAAWHEADCAALSWAMVDGDESLRRKMIGHLSAEQLMELSAFAQQSGALDVGSELKALSRFLLQLGRELSRVCESEKAPPLIHLLSTDDWQKVSSELTRNRRRVLAKKLGGRRAAVLRLGSFQDGPSKSSEESEALVWQKVEEIFKQKADELCAKLGDEEDLPRSLERFFAALTGDPLEAQTLKRLFLGAAGLEQRSFASGLAEGDARLLLALTEMDNELAALTLFDCEKAIQERALAQLAERTAGVQASLAVLQHDKGQMKKWKMRSRALQRFLERQVLIADLFSSLSAAAR